jgi:hypothetical protein
MLQKADISSTPGPLNMPLVSQQEQASNHHGIHGVEEIQNSETISRDESKAQNSATEC